MEKLLFIYNADSGKLNGLLNAVQKTFKPSAYSCKLCSLTHGPLSEKKVWREFYEKLEIDVGFYHKDEFEKAFASKFGYRYEFPLVLLQTNKGLEVLISKSELLKLNSMEDLILKIKELTAE